jgi:hypothetical protein
MLIKSHLRATKGVRHRALLSGSTDPFEGPSAMIFDPEDGGTAGCTETNYQTTRCRHKRL